MQQQISDEAYATLLSRIHQLKVPGLKGVARAISVAQSGRKADVQDRINKFLQVGKANGDVIRVLAVNDLVQDALYERPLQSYLDLRQKYSAPGAASIGDLQSRAPVPKAVEKKPWLFFKENPYFKVRKLLTPTAGVCHRAESRGSCTIRFDLSSADLNTLKASPTHKLFLLCGVYDRTKPQTNAYVEFPSPLEMTFNGVKVKDNVKGVKNKPGTAKPADLTRYVASSNTLEMVYAFTKQDYLVFCYMVEKVPVNKLLQQVLAAPRTSKETTVREIVADNSDDDEIQEMSTTLSLKCPVSFTRMQYPVKSIYCTHVPCFDALSYIYLQDQTATWECPVCNKSAPITDLSVNEYVLDILKNTDSQCEAVELDTDGSWNALYENDDGVLVRMEKPPHRPIPEDEAIGFSDDDDDDDDDVPLARKHKADESPPEAARSATPVVQRKTASPVVISLDSDDEDFDTNLISPATTSGSTPQLPPPPPPPIQVHDQVQALTPRDRPQKAQSSPAQAQEPLLQAPQDQLAPVSQHSRQSGPNAAQVPHTHSPHVHSPLVPQLGVLNNGPRMVQPPRDAHGLIVFGYSAPILQGRNGEMNTMSIDFMMRSLLPDILQEYLKATTRNPYMSDVTYVSQLQYYFLAYNRFEFGERRRREEWELLRPSHVLASANTTGNAMPHQNQAVFRNHTAPNGPTVCEAALMAGIGVEQTARKSSGSLSPSTNEIASLGTTKGSIGTSHFASRSLPLNKAGANGHLTVQELGEQTQRPSLPPILSRQSTTLEGQDDTEILPAPGTIEAMSTQEPVVSELPVVRRRSADAVPGSIASPNVSILTNAVSSSPVSTSTTPVANASNFVATSKTALSSPTASAAPHTSEDVAKPTVQASETGGSTSGAVTVPKVHLPGTRTLSVQNLGGSPTEADRPPPPPNVALERPASVLPSSTASNDISQVAEPVVPAPPVTMIPTAPRSHVPDVTKPVACVPPIVHLPMARVANTPASTEKPVESTSSVIAAPPKVVLPPVVRFPASSPGVILKSVSSKPSVAKPVAMYPAVTNTVAEEPAVEKSVTSLTPAVQSLGASAPKVAIPSIAPTTSQRNTAWPSPNVVPRDTNSASATLEKTVKMPSTAPAPPKVVLPQVMKQIVPPKPTAGVDEQRKPVMAARPAVGLVPPLQPPTSASPTVPIPVPTKDLPTATSQEAFPADGPVRGGTTPPARLTPELPKVTMSVYDRERSQVYALKKRFDDLTKSSSSAHNAAPPLPPHRVNYPGSSLSSPNLGASSLLGGGQVSARIQGYQPSRIASTPSATSAQEQLKNSLASYVEKNNLQRSNSDSVASSGSSRAMSNIQDLNKNIVNGQQHVSIGSFADAPMKSASFDHHIDPQRPASGGLSSDPQDVTTSTTSVPASVIPPANPPSVPAQVPTSAAIKLVDSSAAPNFSPSRFSGQPSSSTPSDSVTLPNAVNGQRSKPSRPKGSSVFLPSRKPPHVNLEKKRVSSGQSEQLNKKAATEKST